MYAPDNTTAVFITEERAEQYAGKWRAWKTQRGHITTSPVYKQRALRGYRAMVDFHELTNDDIERLDAI